MPDEKQLEQRPSRKLMLLILGAILLIIAGAGLYFCVPAFLFQRDYELDAVVSNMEVELRRIRGIAPGEPNAVIEQFFRLYSREEWKTEEHGNVHHPDSFFLSQLPAQVPPVPRRGLGNFWRNPYRDYIKRQCRVLLKNASSLTSDGQTDEELIKLIQQCQKAWQYQDWWKRQGSAQLQVLDLRPSGLAGQQMDTFYRVFCSSVQPGSWEEVQARKVREELVSWNVPDLSLTEMDCKYRPYLVFACYFQFLSQKHFTIKDLQVDCYAAYFVKRLPEKPISVDGIFESEQRLRESLLKLLGHLVPPGKAEPGITLSSLLAQIRQELDYDNYLRRIRLLLPVEEEEKTPPRLAAFVKRFSTSAKRSEAMRLR